ncbi:MauE/DoxX family redox-associated membrane protein [Pedobacter sp. BMA]|uniref:MauE/DoxX family redox-associated membrane protein n=1 Tax=Pedobacter sp. BMA TaxID=1663685 RepID=UPI00069DCF6F|nr:MauE/DoxX family redox-associated membrane protein [Pedobacter sp. BMA]
MKNVVKPDQVIINILSGLLILLWVYVALSKLSDFHAFQWQMRNQVFSRELATLISYVLPGIEMVVAALLFFESSRMAGFLVSAFMLFVFSGYILLIVLHVFPRVPCSCGGVLKSMGWNVHLWFNLAYLLFASWGWWLCRKRKEVLA